jgi:hypothetical protein
MWMSLNYEVIRYSLATEGQLLTVRVDGVQFELEDRVDLVEVDEFLVGEDDVFEEDFDAVETLVETKVVDNYRGPKGSRSHVDCNAY